MKIFARISFVYALIAFLILMTFFISFVVFNKALSAARKVTSRIILFFLGIRVKVEGEADPDARMFIINHQSLIDIMVTEMVTPKANVAWVAKKELFEMPFFGLSLRKTDMISLDREDRRGIVSLLKDSKKKVDDGRTIAIFPEGTRSKKRKILPFKQGAKMIADKYKLKVQPLLLINCGNSFDTSRYEHRVGEVKAVFLEPIEASSENEDWLKDLRIKMQEKYNDELKHNSSYR